MAITIQEIRQKYPDYNHLSDSELADKLHAKFYPQLPKNDFYNRIGFNPQQRPGAEEFKQAAGMNRTPFSAIQDIGVGLGEAGQNIASLLTGGKAPRVDMQETIGAKDPNKFIQGVAQYAPYAMAAPAGLLGGIAGGAAFGASQTQPGEQNAGGLLPEGRTGGAIKDALINALTHGAFKGIEALRPSRLFRGNASPETLQANMQAAQGTTTPLGDVLENPSLKKTLENTLTSVPLSGAESALQKGGMETIARGNQLMKQMGSKIENPENVTDEIHQALLQQHDFRQAEKIKNYEKFNQLADKENLNLTLPKFTKAARDYSDAIEGTTVLKDEPDVRAIYRKLQGYKEPVKTSQYDVNIPSENMQYPVTEYQHPTAKEVNLLSAKLREYGEQHRSSPSPSDRGKSKVFFNLSNALKSDLKDSLKSSGNKDLQSAFQNAEKDYAENYSPFLDKQIYKYIGGNKDSDLIIQDFIRTGKKTDRANLIKQMSKTLQGQQEKLPYAYFSSALDKEGNLIPSELHKLVKNLGKNQFKALVPNQSLRKSLQDYSRLYKMNAEGVHIMSNPKTGARGKDWMGSLLASMATGGAGALKAGVPGLLGGLFAAPAISRVATNMLTSPKIRESLVKAMLENKSWNKGIIPGLQTGAQSSAQ